MVSPLASICERHATDPVRGRSDTRAIYVIGIATLLALSENIFPGTSGHLPAVVHSLTGSPLAIGLTAALVLDLGVPAGDAATRYADLE